MRDNQVLIIGGGVAGLSAAVELSRRGIQVQVADRADFMGGQAIRYACKATEQCVKCGACMVDDKLALAVAHPRINLTTGAQIRDISKTHRFSALIDRKPQYIDPDLCTACGLCRRECPAEGALVRGYSRHHLPFFALNEENCLYVKDGSCTACRDVCPEKAIALDQKPLTLETSADAVILATGFTPFDPTPKPYGYGIFRNVVTTLELERMLKRFGRVQRPSDGKEAQRIAFIQCVGSRDAKSGHLWCSKICCGVSLRMAALIKARQTDAEICFFYIDVQSFGKDFEGYYSDMQDRVHMIRSLPGDIYSSREGDLKVIFADSYARQGREALFDLVVLAVGMTPANGDWEPLKRLGLIPGDGGFLQTRSGDTAFEQGVFVAGSAGGPMSIADSITDAGRAAWNVLRYLRTWKE